MRIIGVLSYWNESPSWLAASVSSAARCCDQLVAVDGRYALFPSKANHSPLEQTEAILQTAAGAGLPVTLHVPATPFYGNEVEKRNLTFNLARAVGEEMVDWVLVFDADTYILEVTEFLHHDLETTELHSANGTVEEYRDMHNPEEPMDVAHTHRIPDVTRSPFTCLFRLLPELRYEQTHYSISGLAPEGKVWLWGMESVCTPLDVGLVVRHRNLVRTMHRRMQAVEYYAKRDRLGIEVRPSR